ncbi:hypothetical protein [Bradyrhizobium sp. CCGUVB1N3]|uniref:hypothetical protein n=1 Tax=Bradyrhizobium sp. CCGUVB1N3 TaxID=2949629 RepID=UPI00353214A6
MESLYRANRLSLVVSQAECICRWPALLRLDGTLVTRWAISRDAFQAYIDHVLAPELKFADIIVMDDHLSGDQGAKVRESAERAHPALRGAFSPKP